MDRASRPNAVGVRIEVEGAVQGIGFRPWVYSLATAASLGGRIWNDSHSVTIEAFGDAEALEEFVERVARPPMPAAYIRELRRHAIPYSVEPAFRIVASRTATHHTPSIPPDLAMCEDCRRELFDPSGRRYRYPFLNCTRCGPRYTITTDSPYDRSQTTMERFAMCPDCRAEYENPLDRRYHAQPIACPACGPRLSLWSTDGDVLPGDPILAAAALLRGGHIVAVKGLGGYHLACDATSAGAVACLRARKHRERKPFAVMVKDLDAAGHVACLTATERALLLETSRPIVLVPARPEARLASDIAPDLPVVGLMLPYTPIHELLLEASGIPLVMTSGNRRDEPMVCNDSEARERLSAIADAILQHDRPIANRCDDSVTRVIAGTPVVMRRGRGWTPGALRVPRAFPRPVLACGAHMKNSFCLGRDDLAWLGPHVGDLETDEACRDFESMVERFSRFVDVEPEIVVHDLHPEYFTTQWAERSALPHIGVQHHHAHVASAMAENGLDEPVLGLAWDGTGYGTDGTAWGGELLRADFDAFERLATFRAIPLAGGDTAIHQVWRIALALLDDAFDGEPPLDELRLFRACPSDDVEAVRRMIELDLNVTQAHGVGRYFDAIGALVLATGESRYEGEIAMRFAFAADDRELRPYRFTISDTDAGDYHPSSTHLVTTQPLLTADLRPTVRDVVTDLACGVAVPVVSGRFHATLAAAARDLVRAACAWSGALPVVLTGGCFQNALLTEAVTHGLAPMRVYTHRNVPPNDGGIALGQSMIAAARCGARNAAANRWDRREVA